MEIDEEPQTIFLSKGWRTTFSPAKLLPKMIPFDSWNAVDDACYHCEGKYGNAISPYYLNLSYEFQAVESGYMRGAMMSSPINSCSCAEVYSSQFSDERKILLHVGVPTSANSPARHFRRRTSKKTCGTVYGCPVARNSSILLIISCQGLTAGNKVLYSPGV